jgi:quinohemoprotein ethanol dehydrogenase
VRRTGTFLRLGAALSIALITAVGASGSRSKEAAAIPAFTAAQLSAPSGADWITENGNNLAWRYSSLNQINGSNGNSLKLAWSTTFTPTPGTTSLKTIAGGNPIAYGGIVYTQDDWGRTQAVDGTSGKILWAFDPGPSVGGGTARGNISVGDGKVFTTRNGSVYAIDAKTGTQVWATQVVDPVGGNSVTVAPLYFNGLVIAGTNGGDSGGICMTFALNAKTGKVTWHYSNIPVSPSQVGWNTWPTKRYFWGGGSVWDPVAISTTFSLVYVPVSNMVPQTGVGQGPGENFPTEGVLALHAMTGKFAWGYQEIHHDIWDMDAMKTPTVATIVMRGKKVEVVDSLNKDCYNFILNAATGKPVLPIPEVPFPQDASMNTWPTQPIPVGDELIPHKANPADWAGQLAPDGKPYVIPDHLYTPYGTTYWSIQAPAKVGGTNWYESSYSQRTGYYYACVNLTTQAIQSWQLAELHSVVGGGGFSTVKNGPTSPIFTGRLLALDMTTNKMVWKQDSNVNHCVSPIVTTAGGNALISQPDGTISAYDDKTGAPQWTLNTGSNSLPRFSFYAANGKEYLIATGEDSKSAPTLSAWTLG